MADTASNTGIVSNNDMDNDLVQLDENEQKSSAFGFFTNADILRQIILILALAISLTLVVFILLWGKESEMRPLGTYQTAELIETLDFLDQEKIDYKINGDTVSVSVEQYQNIKHRLRRAGLTTTSLQGDDILMQDMGFGVSQRVERERLKLGRERQIARALEEFKQVSKAQVLLAIPKENVFAKRDKKPSATVVLTVRNSAAISQEHIDAMVQLVASAVQGLEPTRVTLTDQNGRLLNSGSQDMLAAKGRREFEMVKNHEREYRTKIDSILIPILGVSNYTAEVDVTMDFSVREQTQKRFNPDLLAVRSEMLLERQSFGNGNQGIPGALTNQPPLDADIPEEAGAGNAAARPIGQSQKESTRNYELDTTISHTKSQTGVIQRLSVSVAIDYINSIGADGVMVREPRSQAEIANIRRVLQGGIGFNVNRGDSLEVVAISFNRPELTTMADIPIWEEEWFWRAVRVAASLIVIVILIMAVIRPMIKRLINSEPDENIEDLDLGISAIENDEDMQLLTADTEGDTDFVMRSGHLQLPNLHKDEDLLEAVRALVANEPDLTVLVIKEWMIEDA
ncbi:flagellar basal-body MS-ring/collar protein FliF [Moritella yayanosii]|uniref:Flagellar M-ring protein n=1 Tax=Moritella yayanosii TaxID=69539 RepID=A0A330LV11_9GAMM|nr:flagellar basal-body MS-ring/collar protein FliF [Moritella yayanosii]SQD80589.1 putative flagellar M-ring protein FliF [Moritella yayanosii]